VSTRTFFTYFASKEDVLFLQREDREEVLVEAMASRRPGERFGAALLRLHDALVQSLADDDDLDVAMSPRSAATRPRRCWPPAAAPWSSPSAPCPVSARARRGRRTTRRSDRPRSARTTGRGAAA
jgi:AcrR family transcriptional regulator